MPDWWPWGPTRINGAHLDLLQVHSVVQNRQGGGLSQPYVLVKGGSKEGDGEQRESRCRKETIGLDYGTGLW